MLDIPIPLNVNIPPKIGEVCYFHSSDVKNMSLKTAVKNQTLYSGTHGSSYYICLIRCPDGELRERAVHYSTPEDSGSKPYITRQEGVLESIKTELNNSSW